MSLYIIMQAFFPGINPMARMTCSLCKWKAFSFSFTPHNEKNHCKGSATTWAPWSLVFPKVSQKSIVWKDDLMSQALLWTTSIIFFWIKRSAMRASVGWMILIHHCALPPGGTRWPSCCRILYRILWLMGCHTGRKVSCHDFFWKVVLVLIIKPHVMTMDSIIQSCEMFYSEKKTLKLPVC